MKTANAKRLYAIVCLVIVTAMGYYGITAESLTTWESVGKLIAEVMNNPACLVAIATAIVVNFIEKKEDDEE